MNTIYSTALSSIDNILQNEAKIAQDIAKINFLADLTQTIDANNNQIIANLTEGSEVDLVRDLVQSNLNKIYLQANLSIIQTADEMLGSIIDLIS